MVYVMINGPRIGGVFETVFHARCHLADAAKVTIKQVVPEEQELTGHILLKIDDYVQARLVKTTFF